jgi:hypothetical protein
MAGLVEWSGDQKTVLPGHSGIVDHDTKNQNSREALVWSTLAILVENDGN